MKSRFEAVKVGDRWFVCDATGDVVVNKCPCCERPMLTEEAAKAVAEVVEKRPEIQ